MQLIGTIEGTHCPMIIMLIPQKKRGVAANVLYTYVGPTYVYCVVAIIRYWYSFQINRLMIIVTVTYHCHDRHYLDSQSNYD